MHDTISADGLSEIYLGILLAFQSVYLVFDNLSNLIYALYAFFIPLILSLVIHYAREKSIYSILAEYLDNPQKIKVSNFFSTFIMGLCISFLILGITKGKTYNLPEIYNILLGGIIFIILFINYLFRAAIKGNKLFKILAILLILLSMLLLFVKLSAHSAIGLLISTQSIPLMIIGFIYRKKFLARYYNNI